MDYISSTTLENDSNKDLLDLIYAGINVSLELKNLFFEQSEVYHVESKKNISEKNIRSSLTHKFYYNQNQTIFGCVDNLIEMINRKYGTLFTLIPNDIDVIKYERGDFFQRHKDFIPIKSKYATFYSLIYCLYGDSVGGETIIYDGDSPTKFTETITKSGWVLFRNDLEHESLPIESGTKIVLKANVLHTNLSVQSYNIAFDKLVGAKNSIISEFKSTKKGILPVYDLGEYLFYRKCFENDKNVVPFQMICAYGDFDHEIEFSTENVRCDNNIIWLNVGNTPLIQLSTQNLIKNDKLNENAEALDDIKKQIKNIKNNIQNGDIDKESDEMKQLEYMLEYNIKNKKIYENELSGYHRRSKILSKFIDKFTKNKKMNEIEQSIAIMVSFFWYTSLIIGKDDKSQDGGNSWGGDEDKINIDLPGNKETTVKLINSKIEENMKKIKKQEKQAFYCDKLNLDYDVNKIEKIFNEKFVNELKETFKKNGTIEYHKGGTHYCNDHSYVEYQCDINYGFINLE